MMLRESATAFMLPFECGKVMLPENPHLVLSRYSHDPHLWNHEPDRTNPLISKLKYHS
jgi:hypothetical protein